MGWTYILGVSRQAMINELVSPYETDKVRSKVLAHTVCDDILWDVREFYDKGAETARRIIFCTLMESRVDERGLSQGYKIMEEGMHPYFYSCPLEYLNMVPDTPENRVCQDWRKGVRQYHLLQKAKQKQGG